ncbi:MAG: hypothetical protein ABL957_07175 [Parvularculaceae bacterium]
MISAAKSIIRQLILCGVAVLAAACGAKSPAGDAPVDFPLPEIRSVWDHKEFLLKGQPIIFEADEPNLRNYIRSHVLSKLLAGDFAEIERLATIYRDGMRTPSGIEKLAVLYWSFTDITIVDRAGVREETLKLFDQWMAQYPQSPTPYIAAAHLFDTWARSIGCFCRDDTPAERVVIQDKLDRALSFLTGKWEIVRRDPHSHAMKIQVLAAGAKSAETAEEAFEAARREHSGRYAIYFNALSTAPEMFSSPASAGAFTEKVANSLAETMGAAGDVGYARVWWSGDHYRQVSYLFSRGMVNWPRIRNGFFQLIGEYPEPWNFNAFARFSCIVGDVATLRRLEPAVRKYPIDQIWPSDQREYCLLFAEAQTEDVPEVQ